MSDRRLTALTVAVVAVPAVVAGVALGVAVAVGYDKLRAAVAVAFEHERVGLA